jgi:hypothetical protein
MIIKKIANWIKYIKIWIQRKDGKIQRYRIKKKNLKNYTFLGLTKDLKKVYVKKEEIQEWWEVCIYCDYTGTKPQNDMRLEIRFPTKAPLKALKDKSFRDYLVDLAIQRAQEIMIEESGDWVEEVPFIPKYLGFEKLDREDWNTAEKGYFAVWEVSKKRIYGTKPDFLMTRLKRIGIDWDGKFKYFIYQKIKKEFKNVEKIKTKHGWHIKIYVEPKQYSIKERLEIRQKFKDDPARLDFDRKKLDVDWQFAVDTLFDVKFKLAND